MAIRKETLTDTWIGTRSHDVFVGSENSDAAYGGAGNDTLSGNGGDDTLDGGIDRDTLFGGNGNDVIWGDDPLSKLGLHGNDTIDGGAGDDIVYGMGGDDSIVGGLGNDTVWGNEGNDSLVTGDGVDSLFGGDGNDFVGNFPLGSRLDAGDYHEGGAGFDTFFYSRGPEPLPNGNPLAAITIDLRAGTIEDRGATGELHKFEQIITSGSNFHVIGSDADDVISNSSVTTDPARGSRLDGGGGNDTITSGGGYDRLDGGAGDDLIYGGSGDDIIVGSLGADGAYGGAGNDHMSAGIATLQDGDMYDGGAGVDSFLFQNPDGPSGSVVVTIDLDMGFIATPQIEAGIGGMENITVRGDAFVVRGSDIGELITHQSDPAGNPLLQVGVTIDGGGGNDTIFAGATDDILSGGAGDDTVYGGAGDDTFLAGAGNDTYRGDWGSNTIIYNGVQADYDIQSTGAGGWIVTDLRTGDVDRLTDFQRLEFDDIVMS